MSSSRKSTEPSEELETGSPAAVASRKSWLERFATRLTGWVGGNSALAIAVGVVLVWIATGPIFGFSDTWQLVINTGTTVVTFLMVFLIQRAQNKESRAMQLKLNELIAALEGASNHLIGAESLSERDLTILTQHYAALLERVKNDQDIRQSHSIDEAVRRHEAKNPRPVGKVRGTKS